MFCTNCGIQASGAGKFCSSCGFSLKQDAQPAPKETAHSEPPGFRDNANNNEVIRLAGLAMSGDDSVWGEIYERTNRYVYFMALKSLYSEQDAQDITQEVYMQAIRSIGQLYSAESFFGWLRSIVISKCKDLVKKKKPVLLEDESPGLLDSMPEVSDRFLPDMTLDNSESKRMVLELVDALPYQQRQTILFYYYDDMTVDQIAALMECPAGTVKSRLNYARQQIKAGVEEHERKGVKLYGAATLPILTMLLREQAKTLPIPPSLDGSMIPIIKSMSAPQSDTSPPGGYADPANPVAPSGTHTPYGNAKPPDNYTTNPAPQVPQGYASAPPAPGAGVASVTGNAASAVGEAVAGSVASSAAGAVASSAVATAATAISTKLIAIIVASVIAVGGGVFALTRGGENDALPPTRGSITENVGRDSNAGRSPMDNTSDNTPNTTPGINAAVGDIIEFGGYNWRVLEVRDGNALILNENIIDKRAYHDALHATTWEYSSLRQYLNGEFFDSFSQAERARIVETRNANADNQWYGIAGGRETADRIFLLSLEEVVQYFGDSGQLGRRPSDNTHIIGDHFNSMRIADDLTGNLSWWWLRSPGSYSDSAASVQVFGSIAVGGPHVVFGSGGVRPALWLSLGNTDSPSVPTPTPPPGNNAAVGDIIEFGGYEWRVLEVRGGNALILNENIIERRVYNVGGHDTTWEYSSLRRYLNGEFFNSFTQAERARIVETRNANADNQWFGTAGGRETEDRIFLLSLEEVVQYFGDSGQLGRRPSDNTHIIGDHFNSMRIADDLTGNLSWWWLRSPGSYSLTAAHVFSGGTIPVLGSGVSAVSDGVRPALWLNLQS